MNPALITRIDTAGWHHASDGKGNLFVANSGTDIVGQYTTAGSAVNTSLHFGCGLAKSGYRGGYSGSFV